MKEGILYSFEKTIFYPQGGGQSSDTGWINDIPLSDVNKDNGVIWHLLPEELPKNVVMRLDWKNRYINMQQHTGQHILSAAFFNLYGIETVSVHLGTENTLIELAVKNISEDQIRNAESLSNKIIQEHREVISHSISKKELSKFEIRRDIKTINEPIRLIEIDGLDCTGCGGTHVRNTSEVGIIKIIGTDKIRNRVRVQIKIGKSAYNYFELLNSTAQKAGKILSCGVNQIQARINTLLNENKVLNKKVNTVSKKWLSAYAHNLKKEDNIGFFFLKDFTNDDIKVLSNYWLDLNKVSCFMINEYDKKFSFILRIPENLEINANNLIREVNIEMNLKGGGQPKLVQGRINQQLLNEKYLNNLKQKFILFLERQNG